MCSRYYIDPGMTEDISRVVQNIDGRIWLAQGDTRPTDVAPVIGQSEHGLELGICRWGYPLSKSKGLVINARVETVLDKPSFLKRDLISPAVDSGRRFLRMEFPERKEYLYQTGFLCAVHGRVL